VVRGLRDHRRERIPRGREQRRRPDLSVDARLDRDELRSQLVGGDDGGSQRDRRSAFRRRIAARIARDPVVRERVPEDHAEGSRAVQAPSPVFRPPRRPSGGSRASPLRRARERPRPGPPSGVLRLRPRCCGATSEGAARGDPAMVPSASGCPPARGHSALRRARCRRCATPNPPSRPGTRDAPRAPGGRPRRCSGALRGAGNRCVHTRRAARERDDIPRRRAFSPNGRRSMGPSARRIGTETQLRLP
jgi:hypothetical protein